MSFLLCISFPPLILPRNLYAVSGVIEENVFFESIAQALIAPFARWGRIFRTIGRPGLRDQDAGTYPFQLASATDHATSTLHVANMSGRGDYRVLVVGDSTVSGPGGPGMAELKRLFERDPNTRFQEVGTNSGVNCTPTAGTEYNDSTGKRHAIHCEGWPGKKSTFYFTGQPPNGTYNGGHGPFVFDGAFNFTRYLQTNNFSLQARDWVIFDLGTNDVHTFPSDTAVQNQISQYLAAMDGMIAGVKSYNPDIRIGIGLPVQWAEQSGYDAAFNHAGFPNAARSRRSPGDADSSGASSFRRMPETRNGSG